MLSDEVRHMTEISEDRKFQAFTLYDIGLSLLLTLMLLSGVVLLVLGVFCALNLFRFIDDVELAEGLIVSGACTVFICWTLFCILFDRNVFKHVKASNSITCIAESVLQTFKDIKMIPEGCSLKIETDERGFVTAKLEKASLRSQKLFSGALEELYSPIENQRYVILPRKKFCYNFRGALACPEAFGSKREFAEIFAKNLKKSLGNVDMIYTRGEKGKALLRKCRRNAYIYTSSADGVDDIYGN